MRLWWVWAPWNGHDGHICWLVMVLSTLSWPNQRVTTYFTRSCQLDTRWLVHWRKRTWFAVFLCSRHSDSTHTHAVLHLISPCHSLTVFFHYTTHAVFHVYLGQPVPTMIFFLLWFQNLLLSSAFIMVALCNRADHYIFALCFLSFFFLFFPRLISVAVDWMPTILPYWP